MLPAAGELSLLASGVERKGWYDTGTGTLGGGGGGTLSKLTTPAEAWIPATPSSAREGGRRRRLSSRMTRGAGRSARKADALSTESALPRRSTFRESSRLTDANVGSSLSTSCDGDAASAAARRRATARSSPDITRSCLGAGWLRGTWASDSSTCRAGTTLLLLLLRRSRPSCISRISEGGLETSSIRAGVELAATGAARAILVGRSWRLVTRSTLR